MAKLTDEIKKILREDFKGDDGYSSVPSPETDSKGSSTECKKGVQDEDDVGEDNSKITKGKGRYSNSKTLKSENDVDIIKEDEELEEISKSKLGKYVNRAVGDIDDKAFTSGLHYQKQQNIKHKNEDEGMDPDNDESDYHEKKWHGIQKKIDKRKEGISKATSRLTKEDIDISDDIDAIFSGEDLSEDFKEKASEIFKAAVLSVANKVISESLEEMETEFDEYVDHLSEDLEDYKSGIYDEVTEQMDKYLSYVVEEWKDENKVALEKTARTEIAESFINGLKELFENHYIEVPESKQDILESTLEEKLQLELKLEELYSKNIDLKQELVEIRKQIVLNETTNGLSDNQKNKIKLLAESMDFEDEESFAETVEDLKERYFPVSRKQSLLLEDDTGVEIKRDADTPHREVNSVLEVMHRLKK